MSDMTQAETERRRELAGVAEWVASTCLLYGTSVETACTIAGIFVGGLQREKAGTKEGR